MSFTLATWKANAKRSPISMHSSIFEPMIKITSRNSVQKQCSCKKEIDSLKVLIEQYNQTHLQSYKALKEQIVQLQRKANAPATKTSKSVLNLLPHFPLTSDEAFLKIEEDVNRDPEIAIQLSKFFKRRGGDDMEAFARSCLKSFLTDSVAEHFCWLGTKEKQSIKAFSVLSILKSACFDRFHTCTEISIERVIKKHFTYARDRIQKKMRATSQKK